MKTKIALLCLAIMTGVINSHAGLYAYDGFAILNNNGGGNVDHDLDLATGNPDFVSTTFTLSFGQTLLLGGRVKTDPGAWNPSEWGADWARLFYQIDNGGFNSLDLPAIVGTAGTDWYVQFEQANTANMVNIASGLTIGTHYLEIYFQAHDSFQNPDADGYLSNGGNNYITTIQVVPEPVTTAAAIFGLTFVAIGLWRKARNVHPE